MHVLFEVAMGLLVAIPAVVALAARLGIEVMRATAHPPEGLPPMASADLGPSTMPGGIANL